MRKRVQDYLIILLLFLLVFSCKKESDGQGPVISFSAPAENQSYNVNDVVNLIATVQDDQKLTAASVSLTDSEFHKVHTTVSVPVSSPSMNINLFYTLNNIHLESGYYYLEIFASDGRNDSRKYLRIYITAIPRVVERICLISTPGMTQTQLSYIDPAFTSLTPAYTFSGDYIGSSASSYHQQVYAAGKITGSLNALSVEDNVIVYSITHPSTPNPYYNSLFADEQNTYVALNEGYIRGYDHGGALIFSANANSGFIPQRFCFIGGKLIAEQKAVAGGAKILVGYFASGSPQQQVSMSQDVVAFCRKNDEEVFVFGNAGGQAVIQLYDRLNNNLWDPYPGSLPPGQLLSAVRISEDVYLLGHSNGNIYKYEYLSSSLTVFMTGYTALQLKYEFLQNKLYVAEANTVSVFAFGASPVFQNAIASPDPIRDIHVLYNR